ncbi:hypothetical protein L6R52_33020, partial [Myxococcota bacterium]|nr:hypothetical protein [Myxococcota bacterium]
MSSTIRPEELFVAEREPAKTRLGRWFLHGHKLDEPSQRLAPQPWYRVLWLTGIDYFSTLAYQPGIALLAAGALSPIATVAIVLMTILGALPVYLLVAPRSFAGQGSIALLEHAFESWRGKLLVLVLVGFACTGFVITITISAADAARHATMNPLLARWAAGHQQAVTILLIAPLVLAFLGGFRRAVSWAMLVAIPYVLLNGVVLARCFVEVFEHPRLVDRWQSAVASTGDTTAIFVATALVFPKLALGLSGFETSLSIMPQVKGGPNDDAETPPRGRVAATRKLLVTAALVMSAA